MGRAVVPAIENLPEQVDLALIAVPIELVPQVIEECAAAMVKTVIVISAGGKETGESGAALEARIAAAASSARIRVIGPNCLGVMAPHFNLNAGFAAGMPLKGNLAFVSQSGAVCTAILDFSFKEGIGFSHFVSIGSMVDVDFGDMIDFLGREPSVKSILLYVEQLTNIRKFMSASRAISRVKPIFVLKAGSSKAGALAAASHTGALAGEDAIYDAAFKRAGVVRVRTIEELFDCAELIAKYPKSSGPNMAVVTNGGGPGVMAVDAIAQYGLEPSELSHATVEACSEILPRHWSKRNPVDLLGDASAETYGQVIDILLKDRNVHGLMVILAPQAMTKPLAVASKLIASIKGRSLPVFAVWMGGRDVESAVQVLNDAGVATYSTPERAVNAFSYMVRHSRNVQMLREIPSRFEQPFECHPEEVRKIVQSADLSTAGFVEESTARDILGAYNVPFNPVINADSAESAVAAAQKIGWPVVLKILSADIPHKTDVKGVRLNIQNEEQVCSAYHAMIVSAGKYAPQARLEGVSVQRYIENPDLELLIGAKRDEAFGPVVVFGMGGIFTEVLCDRALSLPPLNRRLIGRLIEETKVAKLLRGYRNLMPVDMEALEMIIQSISQLVVDIPEVAELDINPVIVKDGKPLALDARIRLQPSLKPAPLHLVISPYPAQYELYTTTKSGLRLLIRPIRPEDADLFQNLFQTLSPTSVYFRFFSSIKELTPEMLGALTQIDYDRHIALVAVDTAASPEKMLGVARIIADPYISSAEFSIIVGDPWQGQGIGAALLLNLIDVARQQGIRRIWGTVLRENRQMLNLGKRCGFQMKNNFEDGTYELTVDLSDYQPMKLG
jgi:acetyltransferase